MKEIRIATRTSRLALAQTNQILNRLSSLVPGIPLSIVKVSTQGDRDKSDFLYQSSSVGYFTSEVEKTLLNGRADIAVHSLKDLPTMITEGLIISAIPTREQVSDVIVTSMNISSLFDLPNNASVGTSSLRRISQLKRIRPDLNCQPLRGNIETRIQKMNEGFFDAIVVAQAGLNRLGLSDKISLILDPQEFIPAPGQGALAIQIRKDSKELHDLLTRFDNPYTRIETETERRILAGLHGGCSIPLGVYARIEEDTIQIHAILNNLTGTHQIRNSASCPVSQALQTADRITQQILDEGGQQILDEIRHTKQ